MSMNTRVYYKQLNDSKEYFERLTIFNTLTRHFNSQKKALIWLEEENPLFGNTKPIDLVKQGRATKLLQIIRTMIDGNLA